MCSYHSTIPSRLQAVKSMRLICFDYVKLVWYFSAITKWLVSINQEGSLTWSVLTTESTTSHAKGWLRSIGHGTDSRFTFHSSTLACRATVLQCSAYLRLWSRLKVATNYYLECDWCENYMWPFLPHYCCWNCMRSFEQFRGNILLKSANGIVHLFLERLN